jgi:tetratricopeptide (TPR) repeat protein
MDRLGNADEEAGDSSHVVVIHGIGGIGKSALTRQLLRDVNGHTSAEQPVTSVLVDLEAERQRSPARFPPLEGANLTTILYTVERALTEAMDAEAETAFAEFRSVLGEILHLASRGKSAVGESSPLLTADQLRGIEEAIAISAGLAGLHITSPEVAAGIATGSASISGARRLLRRKRDRDGTPFAAVSQVQLEVTLEPERVLAEAFCSGARKLCDEHTIIVAIDTAELMVHALHRLTDMTRQTGKRFAWVISGRLSTPTEAGHNSTLGAMQRTISNDRLSDLGLPFFDQELQRAYVSDALGVNLSDTELRTIDAGTHGIPLALSLAVDILRTGIPVADAFAEVDSHGDANAIVRGMAERFLHHALHTSHGRVNELGKDLDSIFALAVDETSEAGTVIGFDLQRRLVAALMGVDPAELGQRIDELSSRHDFVLRGSGRLHGEVASVLRRYLVDTSQRLRIAPMHRRVVDLLTSELHLRFAGQLATSRVTNEAWKVLSLAFIRHSFWLSNAQGLAVLRVSFPGIAAVDGQFGRSITAAGTRFEPTAADSERNELELMSALSEIANPAFSADANIVTRAREGLRLIDAPEQDPLLEITVGVRDQALLLLTVDLALAEASPERAATHLSKLSDGGLEAFGPAVRRRAHAIARALTSDERGDDLDRMHALRDAMTMAVAVSADDGGAWAMLSYVTGMLGDESAGLAAANEAIRIQPNNTHYLERRAWRLNGLGNSQGALATIREALLLRPEDAHLHACEAELHVRAGNYESARIAAERSLSLTKSTEATDMLTLAHLALGTPEAAAYVEDAVTSAPESLQSWILAAVSKWNQKDEAAAAGLFNRALLAPAKHQPPRDKAELRAFALAGLGRVPEAIEEIDHWFAHGNVTSMLYYPVLFMLVQAGNHPGIGALQEHLSRVVETNDQ